MIVLWHTQNAQHMEVNDLSCIKMVGVRSGLRLCLLATVTYHSIFILATKFAKVTYK